MEKDTLLACGNQERKNLLDRIIDICEAPPRQRTPAKYRELRQVIELYYEEPKNNNNPNHRTIAQMRER